MSHAASPLLCRSVADASALLKVMANPNRLAILCFLMEGEQTVGTLEQVLGIRQPTLSQQLGELRDAGLIEAERQGKTFRYRVGDAKAKVVIGALRGIFAGLDDITGRQAARGLASEMMFDG